MKKLAFILLLSIGFLASHSQIVMTASSGTNTNAVTQNHISQLAGDANNFYYLTIQVIGTKTSGTPAGTAILYGSLDGTNYWAIGADTATIANSATTVSHRWRLTETRYQYYKVAVATTGTQVSTYEAKIYGRKTPR